MFRYSRLWVFPAVLFSAVLFLYCGNDDTVTEPEPPRPVIVTGAIDLPPESPLAPEDLTVLCGGGQGAVDSSGRFTAPVWEHSAAALLAVDTDHNPVLMGIVTDPTAKGPVLLDARSTALALVFLNPFVCMADAAEADSILDALEAQVAFADFAALIGRKLEADGLALTVDDPEIDSLLTEVVAEYVNSFVAEGVRSASLAPTPAAPTSPSEAPPTIQPDYERSGHRLTWLGGTSFEISNSFGRWAYCCTPTDSFYVFPNGDFLDWVRKGQPWPPSRRRLTLPVSVAETTVVNIYGYGCLGVADNRWEDLTPAEQLCAHYGGFVTVTLELCSHVLGTVCNTARVAGKDAIAERINESILKPIFTDGRVYQRVAAYMEANDPWGCSWFLTKEVIKKIVTSPGYREAFYIITGITLTDGMISTLASWLAIPAKVTLTFNSISSAFKTALALSSARYKTTFKVWKENAEFGNIEGMVADKTHGTGIAGATVTIGGDANNPMNPPHELATDADGHYRFENIGVGERTVTAAKAGYRTASVGVTVVKNSTVTADLELERTGAAVAGYVRNDILIHHSQPSTLFRDDVNIHCRQTGGDQDTYDTWALEGTLSFSLTQGTWWVVARHDDYDPDSVLVTVPADGSVSLPRDLILKPHPTMTGRIYINTDNTGGYEIDFIPLFGQIGMSAPAPYEYECPLGGSPADVMSAAAVRGTSESDYDAVEFAIRLEAVPEAGAYRIGGIDAYGCSGLSAAAAAAFVTTRARCTIPESASYPMSYTFLDDPESRGCNCSIVQPGDIYLTEWSTELGEVVAGGFNIDLAGWNTCECAGSDTDSDGIIDTWEVDCSQARIQLDFRLPVGSDYLVTFRPLGARQIALPPARD